MKLAELAIVVGGVLTAVVAAGHTFFHRLFRWGEDLPRLSPLNQKVLYTIHVGAYLLLVPLALVSFRFPGELARAGGLGGALTLCLAAFWAWRLVWQLVYFGPLIPKVSRGWVRFHRAMIALFAVQAAAYGAPAALAMLGR